MKQLTNRIVEYALILSVVILFVFLIVPWRDRDIPTYEASVSSVAAVDRESAQIREKSFGSPQNVAALFGWKPKRKPVSAQGSGSSVERPAWLRSVGYAVGPDGNKYYFFKNERTGKIIQLAEGKADKGWSLVKRTEEYFILEFQGNQYSIERN